MIPQTTLPLTKLVRTTEGILVIVANIALVLIPILTTALSATTAAKLAAGLDAVTMLSRSIVKAFAVPTPESVVNPPVTQVQAVRGPAGRPQV